MKSQGSLKSESDSQPSRFLADANGGDLVFETTPSSYRHWNLEIEAPLAWLTMAVAADGGAMGDYELKLNSYDIGVDIELADAVRRIRFEHPEVRCVVIGSAIEGVFCAGANIKMLAAASHSHKVNFCKFTNETRLEMEEASEVSGVRFLAAIDGPCSGGGYELAMACDHLLLIDDRSTTVSLPEVPLLGVLPGTGGLTRLTDKRHVRRDRADVFATKAEGIGGEEALAWGLVDELAPPSQFTEAVADRAMALAESSPSTYPRSTATSSADSPPSRPESVEVKPLESLAPEISAKSIRYQHVLAELDHNGRAVALTVTVEASEQWPLRAARELDDVLCRLRFNEPLLGTIVIRTRGEISAALTQDERLASPKSHREKETARLWKRVLSRLDLTARSVIALIEPGSAYVGVLAELALAADRSYMLTGIFEDDDDPLPATTLTLTTVNNGLMPMANGLTRIQSRFWGDEDSQTSAMAAIGQELDAAAAHDLGLVTAIPDDLDWDDEVRLAIEERKSFSADALTAMEANHRFSGPETMATKIFSRLSAWQNWVFIRPNASGPQGALQSYGTGSRPTYDQHRT